MTLLTRSRGRQRFFNTPFSPGDLFLGGTQGAWYDPSDMTTLFQDAAGTTPVTAVEQPVGLIFDKSKGATTTRRNLLTYTEAFGNVAWAKTSITVSSDSTTAPDGTLTADGISATANAGNIYEGFVLDASIYTLSIYAKANASNVVELLFVTAGSATGGKCAYTLTGSGTTSAVTQYGGSTGFVASIQSVGNGWYRCTLTGLAGVAIWYSAAQLITNADSVFIWGAQLDKGSTASTYQKITSGIGGEWTPGNHAYQSTAASRPVLRARYNLVTYSEDFGNAAWFKQSGVTVTTNQAIAPDGTLTADLVQSNGTNGLYLSSQQYVGTAPNVKSFYMRTVTGTATVKITDAYQSVGVKTCNLTTTWQRFELTETQSNGLSMPWVYEIPVAGIYLWGAQLLTAADATATGNAYQRVGASTDYATGGVFRPYLAFDGVDDRLATNAVDFTSTSASTIFGGISKNTDASLQVVIDAAATGLGPPVVTLWAGDPSVFGAGPRWASIAGGSATANITTSTAFPAPRTDVLTLQQSISAPLLALRVGGTQAATSAASQGTGTLGSSPIYIGCRSNLAFPLNGRIYSLIVRGAASSAVEVSQTEAWVNAKTGAY